MVEEAAPLVDDATSADDESISRSKDDPSSASSASAADNDAPRQRLWQTNVRERITPYLPPPVTQGIQRLDPLLEPYVGSEATVTVISSLLVSWIVLWLVLRTLSVLNTGRAVDDDEGDVLLAANDGQAETFDATVLLVGPRHSGKTRLFYQLCYAERDVPTLMSLKANVGVSTIMADADDDKVAAAATEIRYMDWPGHASVSDPALAPVLLPAKGSTTRIVLVLDATQPVTGAADTLYQLLQQLVVGDDKRNSTTTNNKAFTTTIFVACHKSDLPKAKNDRRIKIQLRTELERLLTVRAAAAANEGGDKAATAATTWWKAGEPLELDELRRKCGVQLYFGTTSCCRDEGPPGSMELQKFCATGVVG